MAGPTGSEPVIFPSFAGSLFQGNKFFFIATTPGVEGEEFYVSDGTAAGTTMLRDINPGANSGVDATNLSAFIPRINSISRQTMAAMEMNCIVEWGSRRCGYHDGS